jgi:dTDP-glucose 4,6-dehydratase
MRLLITGGAGFIGSNYVRHVLNRDQSTELVVLDKLTYAGNIDNLKGVLQDVEFVKGDICDVTVVNRLMNECDCVVNFAAETHVDRSISNSTAFVRTDVLGTQILLDAANERQIDRFIQVSTDEVYGSTQRASFQETDRLNPSSPYAASKAGADLLSHSYFVTYGFPCIITRSANNYGPFQHPEKLIPRFITRAIRNKTLTVYGKGNNVRDWVYVEDNCRALDCVRQRGKTGEIYNVGAGNEKSNLEVTEAILKRLGKPLKLITFTPDRLGHDYRYSLNCSKIKSLGWQPSISFEDGLLKTVRWYEENESWWSGLV